MIRRTGPIAAAVLAIIVGWSGLAQGSANIPKSPIVFLSPSSAPDGGTIVVEGSAFAPHKALTIAECSKASWIAPQDPCVRTNSFQVTTDKRGQFTRRMVVSRCPTLPPHAGESANCFVGALQPQGVDVITLSGATPLTITGPSLILV